jgi:hypothetical protein
MDFDGALPLAGKWNEVRLTNLGNCEDEDYER